MANTFKIKVAGETQEFEQSLGNLNSGLKMLKSEARSLNRSLKVDPKNTANASKLYENVTQQLELTRKKAEEVKKNLANIDPNVNLKGFVAAQNQLRNLQTESKKLESTLAAVSNQPHELKLHLPHLNGQSAIKPLLSSVQSSAHTVGDALSGAIKSGLSGAGSIATSAGRSIVKGLTAPLSRVKGLLNETVIGGLRQIGASATSKLGDAFSGIKNSLQETQTATNGLKKVMQFQGISSQFEYLRKSLAQTAINTNIDTKTAEKFGSVLIGVGKHASETAKIVDAAANANQAFGGSGEAFESVSLALGQIEAAGKVTADNINQITDANSALGAALKSQVFENYKKAGGAATDFNSAMAKGEISTDDLTTALIELSAKSGKAIQTLPDSFASLEETVGTKLQPVFDSLSQAMVPVIDRATDIIQSMDFTSVAKKLSSINFEQIFTGIGSAITPVVALVTQLKSAIAKAFTEMTGKPATLGNAFSVMGSAISAAITPVIGLIAQMLNNMDFSVIANSFSFLLNQAEMLKNALTQAFSNVDPGIVVGAFNAIGASLQTVISTVTAGWAEVIQNININAIMEGLQLFAQTFAQVVTAIIPEAIQLGSAFGQAFSTLAPGHLLSAFNSIVTGAITMFQTLAVIVANAVSQINLSPFVNAFANVGNAFTMLSQSIYASGLGSALSSIFSGAINAAGRLLSSTIRMANGIFAAIQPLLKGLQPVMNGISSLFNAVSGTVANLWNTISSDITKLVSAFMKEAAPGINEAVKNLKPVLNALGKLFSQVGNTIIWLSDHIIMPILIPAFKALGKIIGWLAKIIAGPIDVITACVDGLVWAFDKLKEGLKAIEKPLDRFMTGAGKTLGKIGEKIGKFFGIKNGLGLDAKIRNYKSDISNSMQIQNNDATINVTPTMGQNPESIAREVARLIRAGAV